nr:frequency clock protein [Quercus suber]
MSATVNSGALAHACAPNPRRSLAHDSVSLLHRPRKRTKRNGDSPSSGPLLHASTREEAASPSSLNPLIGRGSSGESSNVDNWFESANNGARQHSAAVVDSDPPFFLRNASSTETPPNGGDQMPDAVPHVRGPDIIRSPRTNLRMHMDNSSIDDFRSVIDDLTVENKKLKSRLRKYENIYAPHLDHERLFEVRVHGLPPEKKHELEDVLRKFTAGLTDFKPDAFPSNGYEGLAPMALKNDVTNDSAYASASASGQGSSSRSDGKQSRSLKTVVSRQRNIQSYLHDIPEGLMPTREPAAMSDSTRRKLVVRRLEQLFAGKRAVGDGPQQSMQQQEVSQSAARADRSQLEATGQLARQEGNRESSIMEIDSEQNGESSGRAPSSAPAAVKRLQSQAAPIQQQDFAEPSAMPTVIEQRPTRPLDLDPYRAQVPADNIRYMRHLGFSPLDPELPPADEEHGWVYLNFLINMAQLHTINVTAEFVRQAVEAHSERLEVSLDGRKLRWKGSSDLSKLGNSTDGSRFGSPSGQLEMSSPRKRPKLTHSSSRSTAPTVPVPGVLTRYEPNKYAYLPSSYRRNRFDSQEASSSEADDDSAFIPDAGVRSSSGKRSAKNEGPIVFYNNARFCTDLSGTRGPPGGQDVPAYMTLGAQPVGKPIQLVDPSLEKRGTLYDSHNLLQCKDIDDGPPSTPSSQDIGFQTPSPAASPAHDFREPSEMEVSGMGGIWPSDHFSIEVRNRYVPASSNETPGKRMVAESSPRRAVTLGLTSETRTKASPAQCQTLWTRVRALPPSKLPPTLEYMAFGSSSPEDEEMDDEGITDIDQLTSIQTPSAVPAAAISPLVMPFVESDDNDESHDEDSDFDEDEDVDEDDNDSEVSLDLLAAARAVDPEAIRQREREYDANMADRLAEEIPAGSSAATAGGGSGFASPVSGVDGDEYRRAKRVARRQQAAVAGVAALRHAPHGTSAQDEASPSGGVTEEQEEYSDVGS